MTFGFIYEGNIERFLAGTTDVPSPAVPVPARYHCPFCPQSFASQLRRSDHLSAKHFGERPVLQFSGTEPASKDVIRQRFAPGKINVFNCTSAYIRIDGGEQECDVAIIPSVLSEAEGRIRLRLANRFEQAAAPIQQAYDLDFRTYPISDLDAADLRFVECLGRESVSIGNVDEFLASPVAKRVAAYSDALAEYVIGVLWKDRPAAGSGRQLEYRSKLNSSLRELQEFDRPLANLISALIRLSGNDVARPYRRTGAHGLNAVLNFFHDLTNGIVSNFGRISRSPRVGRIVCPIDNGTCRVLEAATSLAGIQRFSDDVVDRLKAEQALPSVDPLDKVKLAALWAARAICLEMKAQAEFPLRELIGDAMFGPWAEKTLEELYD